MATEHKMSTVRRARDLHDAGFSPERTAKMLAAEGTPVHANTVRQWVDPDYARRQAASVRRSSARARARAKPPTIRGLCPQEPTPELRLARIHLLREAGLTPAAIAKAMAVDFAEPHWNRDRVVRILAGDHTKVQRYARS